MITNTIGPGKDYATIQAWIDAVVSVGPGDNTTGECYSGSDLGGVSWNGTNTGEFHVTIEAAIGQQHNGRDVGVANAAYTGDEEDWIIFDPFNLTVRGMRIQGGFVAITTNDSSVYSTSNVAVLFEKNLLVRNFAGSQPNGVIITTTDTTGVALTAHVWNNVGLFQAADYGTDAAGIIIASQTVGAGSVIGVCANNTIIRSGSAVLDHAYRFILDSIGGAATLVVQMDNNIGLQSSASDYAITGADAGFISFVSTDYNLSSDATGDDFGGGIHNQINKTAATTVVNDATDPRLKAGSTALNAGTTLAFFSTDVIGTSRPQGPAWDIGAFEMVGGTGIVVPGGGGGRFWAYRRR